MLSRKQFLKSTGALLASLISIPFIYKFMGKWDVSTEKDILQLYTEMVPMIKDRLEYEGFARQVLATRELRQGEIQKYPKDINATATMIRENGSTVEVAPKWDKIFPPEFLVSATSFRGRELLKEEQEEFRRTTSLCQQEMNKLSFKLMSHEDRSMLRLLYHSAVNGGTVLYIDQVNKEVLEQFKKTAKNNNFSIDKIVINRAELGDIRNNNKEINYVSVMSSSSLVSGHFGSLDGIQLYVSEIIANTDMLSTSVPEGMIFILPKPEELGQMPERISLIAVPAEERIEGKRQEGVMMVEQISQVIFDTRKVIVAIKPNCIVPTWMIEDAAIV